MKKLFTFIIALLAVASGMQAQTAWNTYWVTANGGTGKYACGYDTMYVGIVCRNGKYETMTSKAPGSLTSMALPTAYNAGDSVTWKIVKGAAIGTTPRVRFINVKTGEYLYQGKNGGTSVVAYVAPLTDPNNGVKDFELRDQGTDGKGSYYYFIVDGSNNFRNDATGAINITATNQGWKFVPKQGPQPKTTIPVPTLDISAVESSVNAGGKATLNVTVTKGSTALLGQTLLYHGSTLLDTLDLDASGKATFVYEGLKYGTETFAVVYSGDANYGPEDKQIILNVGPSVNAKPTVLNVTLPSTSETHKDVSLNISVKEKTGSPVISGDVVVYVNNIAKNRVTVDASGLASIVYPNLLAGTTNFKAVYIGDKYNYLDADTVRTSINLTASTSKIKPYPVYFDVAGQPEIARYLRRGVTSSTTRPFTVPFYKDSLAGITTEIDTIVKYTQNALSYTSSDKKDMYMNADLINVPLGSGRSKWISFKTPWLNEGSYNVYISHRVNSDPKITFTSVTMDDKELYFPNEEMNGRWFRSWATVNNRRRWNSLGHSGNLGMNYIGSVKVDKSDTHNLKISVADENGTDVSIDMLEFIPVDMDSVKLTETAAVDFAKLYYPMFDLGGFAKDSITKGISSMADASEFAVPYQISDPTVYQTKSYTIPNLGNVVNEMEGNYVIVYRKDKWTRIAEGAIANKSFTCSLPVGDYYYQEINYIDLGTPGAAGYRTFISEGTFSITTGLAPGKEGNVKSAVNGNNLTIDNLESGARVLVYDMTGKILVNTVANSTQFNKNLKPSVYIVRVISKRGNFVNKVIVK